MPLHEVLQATREDVLQRWKARVRGTLAPENTPQFELLDHIPDYLAEIESALRCEAEQASATALVVEQSSTAAEHGGQRLRLGFSLDSVVREYGALRDAIISAARDTGAQVTFRELQVVSDCIVSGIAKAVSEYTRQRDAEQMRQANEHFAFIAHELRNPLSSAVSSYEVLAMRGDLPRDNRAVAALERGLRRTIELVDQTLRLARVASGIDLRRRETTLRALCDDAELDALCEAEDKGVVLDVTITSDETVHLDERLVRSALTNLLRNGVKYTQRGGTVQLSARVEDLRAVFEVADGCGGLPHGTLDAVFAPFVRLDDSQPGFGLGLAITKQAADAHGGTIRVDNVPGGCKFVLELPLK